MRRLGNKYQEYFQDKMDEYDIDSPKELSEDRKKEFFEDVDDGWDAENESDGKVSTIASDIVGANEFVSYKDAHAYLDTIALAYKSIVSKHPELRRIRGFQRSWSPVVDWVTNLQVR